MDGFSQYKFCEVAKLINGRAYLMPELQDSGKYRIVRVGNFSGKDEWFFSDMELEDDKYCFQGDLLFCWSCTFGPYIWKSEKTIYHYHIWKIEVNPEKTDKYYLFYYLKFLTPQLLGGTNGCTMAHITKENMERKKILIHTSVSVQKKIASILKSYDDLIENNNKRIKILEQMAQELYKEWFVRLRFPGYKTSKIIDGIPEGWQTDKIESIGVFRRGKNITASEMVVGNIPVISAGIEPSGFHNKSNAEGVSITISSSGANAGFLRINYSDIWAADCLCVNNVENVFYLYELLNNIRPYIDNLQRGAAQPHVYAKDVNRLKIVLPSEHIRKKFNNIVKDMHQSIAVLAQQNELLEQQRDLLLPRLMSGKLEIKGTDDA